MLSHYINKKERDREEILNVIEYLAMLVSINPKGVAKIISGRKKQKQMAKNKEEKEFLTVNENGENEFGQKINTTFFADIEKYAGKEALSELGDTKDYVVHKKTEEESDNSFDDDDDKFIQEAKKAFMEREKEIIEEEKFKKEHPELFNSDELIF